MAELSQETKDHLHRQLIRLGDMMGDGLHHEPDGKWIPKEYKRVMKALGLMPKKRNNSEVINQRMIERVNDVACGKCSGKLMQTRSGSKRAACVDCGAKWQLLK